MVNRKECSAVFGLRSLKVTQFAVGGALRGMGAYADKRYVKPLWTGLLLVLVSCGLEAAEKVATVKRTVPHSGYSEGLDFHKGKIWHALPKKLVQIDPKNGEVLKTYAPATQYSESLVWFEGSLWNVSYSDNGLYRGKLKGDEFVFKRVGSVPEAHAWGLTHNGKHLIVTGNYSNKLYFLNPTNAKVVRTLVVPGIKDIEDLAWDGEALWSSSFTQHKGTIFRIDPKSGKVTHFFKLPKVDQCPVIDGIAYDGKGFWVTGKHCVSLWYLPHPLKGDKTRSPRANASKKSK